MFMKKGYLTVVSLLLSVPLAAQLYVEPEQDVECTVFLEKEGRGRAQQGLEIWDDCIFSCEDGGHVNVYDFKTADSRPIAGFELASSHPDNHVNNVCFGIETKRGASFPLLYITNGKVGSELEWLCFVESITRRGKRFSSELVQTIELDASKWAEKGYASIFGAPSWLVDREQGFMWVFSARKRTVASVTKNAWENQYVATKFRIPSLSEGAKVRFDEDDILDQVVFPYDVWFTQAGCMHDGKIYYCFGVGKQDDRRPSCIRVYDTRTRTITARYNVQDQVVYEPEDIVIRDGFMYVNTNTNPRKTSDLPCIFRLSLPKAKPEAKTALDEIRRDPERAGGVYYVTDLSHPLTPAPRGYKPFYINGYFRHGARHIDDSKTYPTIYGVLERAHAANNLTAFGEAIYERLAPFKKNLSYKEGDLTQIGYRQAREIGRRMVRNYPEVFDEEPYLKTHATNVLRVAATMQSVNSGILSLRPDLEWAEIDNSRSFLPALNPYGSVCPDRSPLDAYILGQENGWYKKYRSYMDEKLDLDAFMSRLFVDPSPVEEEYDKHDLIRRFWLMASLMQGLDRQVPLWDLFTSEEILAWAEIENYRYFAQKGPEPISHGRSWGLGSRTLRHLLEESAEDIARNRHGINLNFGHDGVLMSLLTNLQVGSWAREAHDPADALQSWQYWDIPMGANLQMVFYRSEADAADILVKFMLNEKDLQLPLDVVEASYYRWEEVYDFYMEHCGRVEKSLAETLKLSYEDF